MSQSSWLTEPGEDTRKSRFTEEQIVAAIKRVDVCMSSAEVGRELWVNDTLRRLTEKYGGLDVRHAQKLRTPQEENSQP